MIRLRAASPYTPLVGVENAAALKKLKIDGSDTENGAPVTSARSEQLVPCAMSVVAPQTRAVNGVPDCAMKFSVPVQPPTMLAAVPLLSSQRRPGPKGSSTVRLPVN